MFNFLAALLATLNLADGILTWYGLDRGLIREANPSMLLLIQIFGHGYICILLKTVISICILLVIPFGDKIKNSYPLGYVSIFISNSILIFVYSYVCISNCILIREALCLKN